MGFFHNEAKAQAKTAKPSASARRHIQLHTETLQQLGCSVCPRDKDKLHTPKMEPQGSGAPVLYILTYGPSERADAAGEYLKDKVGAYIDRLLPRSADRWVRKGGVIQCATDTNDIGQHEMECCRGRVVADIEAAKPLVILGIGDAALGWATGLDAYTPKFRGRLITCKIGSHVCWYYPVMFPSFVFKESKYGPDDREVAFQFDIRQLVGMLETETLPVPKHYASGYDNGIEIITGQEPGDFQRLERCLGDLLPVRRAGLDLETNGLRPWIKDPRVWTAAVGTFENTVAFPLDHPDGWGSDHQRAKVWALFVEYLLHSGIKECHNLAFEMEWLGFKIGPRLLRLTEWDDTMSMAHTIDERSGTKSLEVQTIINFGFNLKKLSNIDTKRIVEYPIKKVLTYNGMDTKWTNQLSRVLRPVIAADSKMQWAHDRKVRLAPTLVITELRGLPVDLDYADTMGARLDAETDAIAAKIQKCPEVIAYTRKFGTFSPTNADHVLKLMDVLLERPEVRRKTRDGTKLTTDEEALAEIPAKEVPSAGLILEHRGIEKCSSTYVRPVTSGRIISSDGMIHAKYSSMTAETGRLAAEDPNAQNWPIRKHREIRGMIAARRKRWMLACDYGQIEFRVAGMASLDRNLVKACWTGYDVHGFWAQRCVKEYPEIKDWIVKEFDVDWDEKGMKTLRQEVKNRWVFPSIFGAVVESRAANMHLPEDIARDLDAEFWDGDSGGFPDVKKWQKRTIAFYAKHLYVETLGGIRRHGPLSANQIINMPIQGTAAEIVTEGMSAVSELALIEDDLDNLHPVLNVHDDLTFEPDDDHLEASMLTIAREMCKPRFDYINVPLIVEMKVGHRWSEMKEIAVYRSNELFNTPNPYA